MKKIGMSLIFILIFSSTSYAQSWSNIISKSVEISLLIYNENEKQGQINKINELVSKVNDLNFRINVIEEIHKVELSKIYSDVILIALNNEKGKSLLLKYIDKCEIIYKNDKINPCPVISAMYMYYFKERNLFLKILDKIEDANENSNNKTPLHIAVYFGDVEIIKKLIDKKCNINFKNQAGITPLMSAVIGNIPNKNNIIQFFIKSGADLEIKNNEGKTAIDIASEEIKQFILSCK